MLEDTQLLRRYAEEKSQDAFAELVRRRVDFVYSVALRQVGGDAHLAQDVTQKVFVDLARKAPALAQRAVLSGWLYRSAQFAASDVVRSERRRRAREQESHTMQEISANPTGPADWEKVRPLLDEAMGELGDDDRDAVALRFFEGRAFAEIGRALRLTEEAARKRVERALDKLAGALSRRGVTSTSTALGLALAHQAIVAAPSGLAANVTGVALAGAPAAAGLVAFFASAKVSATLGAAAAVALGAAIYEGNVARQRAGEAAVAQRAHAALRARIGELAGRLRAAEQRAQAADEDNARLLAAIERAKVPAAAAQPGATEAEPADLRATVQARYDRAKQLARDGQWEAALPELLWCYDDGMLRVGSFAGVRGSFLLSDLAELGRKYPPALVALRTRRDGAEQRLLADAADREAARDFANLNRVLGDSGRTLQLYDRLSPEDRRRSGLATLDVFQLLLDARRYADATQALPYDRMVSLFTATSRAPDFSKLRDPEGSLQRHRANVVSTAAKNVEVLAGAGELTQAKAFAERILAFDSSAETRAVLERHLARAGQPDLLKGP